MLCWIHVGVAFNFFYDSFSPSFQVFPFFWRSVSRSWFQAELCWESVFAWGHLPPLSLSSFPDGSTSPAQAWLLLLPRLSVWSGATEFFFSRLFLFWIHLSLSLFLVCQNLPVIYIFSIWNEKRPDYLVHMKVLTEDGYLMCFPCH